jgi:kanamycin kinase
VSSSLAGPPPADEAVPAAVVAAAEVLGATLRPVWRNQLGGLTYELLAGSGGSRWFVKWTPTDSGIDLGAEVDRLAWAAGFTPVPRVVDQGADDDGTWFVSEGLAGDSAVADRWRAVPEVAVPAIGAGLRALHDALPVAECRFSWSLEDRLASVDARLAAGAIEPAVWHEDHQALDLAAALATVREPPPVDQLVVCHGDACAPNTLVGDDGRWSGHVDLGRLGRADRWADLAIASWSTEWNYGAGFERALLDAYGIDPDPDRTRYYRLLWDLSD